MKKRNIISGLVFLAILNSCDVLNFADESKTFEYQFSSDKELYTLQDTVQTTFINKSGQSLYLYYQFCTLADMQKLENENWESVPITYGCLGVEIPPVEVKSFESLKIEVKLERLHNESFEEGTHRLDVLVSYKDRDEFRELISNNFEINR